MQENNFVVFKKSMRKHIFKTSHIFFLYKRNVQNMLGYWPYATHKKTFFWYICEFVALRQKPGILNTRLIFFYNIKNSDLKTNIPENHKSLSLSFFEKKKRNETSRSGHKKKTQLLFKWIIIHLNSKHKRHAQ